MPFGRSEEKSAALRGWYREVIEKAVEEAGFTPVLGALDRTFSNSGGWLVEAINAHDIESLARLMTNDHAFVDGVGRRSSGREAMLVEWQLYYDVFQDYVIRVEEIIHAGRRSARKCVWTGVPPGAWTARW